MEGGTLTDQFRDSLDFRLSPKGIVAFTLMLKMFYGNNFIDTVGSGNIADNAQANHGCHH